MKEQIYQDVKNALQQLADALGVASEHLWVILVKQQIVEAIVGLTFAIVFIFSLFILKHYHNIMESDRIKDHDLNNGDYKAGHVAYFIVYLSTSAILLAITVHLFPDIFIGFINPEYGAFKEIQGMLK